jgi:hypothetical protein
VQRARESLVFHRHLHERMMEMTPLLALVFFSEPGRPLDRYGVGRLFDDINNAVLKWMEGWAPADAAPEVLAMSLMGAHWWIALDGISRGESVDADVIAHDLTQYFVRGVTGAPPRLQPEAAQVSGRADTGRRART